MVGIMCPYVHRRVYIFLILRVLTSPSTLELLCICLWMVSSLHLSSHFEKHCKESCFFKKRNIEERNTKMFLCERFIELFWIFSCGFFPLELG